MTSPLLRLRSEPRSGAPLEGAEVQAHLGHLHGWTVIDDTLEKTFGFRNFHHTMAFVNALAWIAHTENHHPDLLVSFNRCVVRFSTHSVHGLSLNDFICAAKTDALEMSVADGQP